MSRRSEPQQLGPAAKSGKALKTQPKVPVWKLLSYTSAKKPRSTADLKSKITTTVNDAIEEVVVHQRWTNPVASDLTEQAKLIGMFKNFNCDFKSKFYDTFVIIDV